MASITTFTYEGKIYEIKLTLASVKKFEAIHGPIVALASRPGGFLSVQETEDMMAVAMFNDEGNRVGISQAAEIAEGYIVETGLMEAQNILGEALERDCGFLTKTTEADVIG